MTDWKIIPQGCPTTPNLRTLIQGPGHGHVLLVGLPADLRARLASAILRELKEIELADQMEAILS